MSHDGWWSKDGKFWESLKNTCKCTHSLKANVGFQVFLSTSMFAQWFFLLYSSIVWTLCSNQCVLLDYFSNRDESNRKILSWDKTYKNRSFVEQCLNVHSKSLFILFSWLDFLFTACLHTMMYMYGRYMYQPKRPTTPWWDVFFCRQVREKKTWQCKQSVIHFDIVSTEASLSVWLSMSSGLKALVSTYFRWGKKVKEWGIDTRTLSFFLQCVLLVWMLSCS